MEKNWLKEYPKIVPATVDVKAYASLADFFEQVCYTFKDKIAYSHDGVRLSYKTLFALST